MYAALDMSALIDSTRPNRKSGYVLGYFQPELSKLANKRVLCADKTLSLWNRVGL
jgi:hypothetical protein